MAVEAGPAGRRALHMAGADGTAPGLTTEGRPVGAQPDHRGVPGGHPWSPSQRFTARGPKVCWLAMDCMRLMFTCRGMEQAKNTCSAISGPVMGAAPA